MGQIRGRRSVSWCVTGIVVLSILSTTLSLAAATQYTVGDAAGWIPYYNYTDWAASKTLREGDTIVFAYSRGEHDVLRVSADDYAACRASDPIDTDASGVSRFQLHTGPYYFICGFPAHCTEGSQKVSFNVIDSTNTVLPTYNQSADTPVTYDGPSVIAPAFAPAPAPSMSQPCLLPSLMLLTFGYLLGICGPNL